MEFSLEEYIKYGLLVPIAQIGIALVVFVLNIISLLYHHFANASASILMALFALVFMLLVLHRQIPSALKYTRYLFIEGEWNAVTLQGELQDIVVLNNSPNYHILGETAAKAALITIKGEEFYFMSAKGLTIGNDLIVRYLPQSRVVLSWRNASHSPFEA